MPIISIMGDNNEFNTDCGENKIKIENLTKSFNTKCNRTTNGYDFAELVALSHVNLSVRNGEFMSIVGPTGCGKSTLLDLVAGLSSPTQGKVYINGNPINGPGMDRSIVFQNYALFPWLTVFENIEFGLKIQKIEQRKRKELVRKYTTMVGLSGFEKYLPHQLSGGMKQRVAIARALVYDPDVVLMDEPFTALDALTREVLQRELLHIWRQTGKTILFVTHNLDEAVFLSNRIAVMTTRPGSIKKIIKVPLKARDRFNEDVRSSKTYIDARNFLWNFLQREVAKQHNAGLLF